MRCLKAFLIILMCGCICACSPLPKDEKEQEEMVAVWVTYSEIENMILSEEGFEAEFTQAVGKCAELGINTLFFHTVAFGDAVYNSKIYPFTEALSESKSDILSVAVKTAHQNGIKIHAWLNPYRISTKTSKLEEIIGSYEDYEISEVLKGNGVSFTEGGIYLNPASTLVRNKIIGAVREIINGYAVDGIHFDDYFYPTTAPQFDEALYKEYLMDNDNPLTLEEWRRVNVNSLILGVGLAVRSKGNLAFGISPAADLDYCYNTLFADVEGWLGGGYIDYIIPQLYFGFDYPVEKFRFHNLLTHWLDIADNKTNLYIGLAAYKSGTDKQPDKEEWQNDNTIIARQIEAVRQNGLKGFAFFSFSSLFNDNSSNAEQLKYIKEVL